MVIFEVDEYKKIVDFVDLMRSKKSVSEFVFQSAGDTKKVSIYSTDDIVVSTNIFIIFDFK